MTDKPQPLTSYENGMLDERAHQNALSRLAMEKHQEEVDALKAELAQLRAQLAECEQWEDVPDGDYRIEEAANWRIQRRREAQTDE